MVFLYSVYKYALLNGFKIKKKIVYIRNIKEGKFRKILVYYGEKEKKLITIDEDNKPKMILVYQDFHRETVFSKRI